MSLIKVQPPPLRLLSLSLSLSLGLVGFVSGGGWANNKSGWPEMLPIRQAAAASKQAKERHYNISRPD